MTDKNELEQKPRSGLSDLTVKLAVTATESVEMERKHIELLTRDAYEKLLAAEKAWYALFYALPLGHERERASDIYENVRCATRRGTDG